MRSITLCVVGPALLGLVACSQSEQNELDWARAALERNTALEVVATDEKSGIFTVRLKETGELRTVRANALVAILPPNPGDAARADAPAPGSPAEAPSAAADSESADGTDSGAPWPTDMAEDRVPEQADESRRLASSEEPPRAPKGAEPAAIGKLPADAAPRAAPQDADGAVPARGTRVLAAGPGYTIQTAGPADPARPGAQTESARNDAWTASAAVERRVEPIVCQGARFMHIDNRNLVFDGDAVMAEEGCEVHITNSRISATGLGITARGASVHIRNSRVEGGTASIEASDGAQIYARSSTFKGMMRRLDSASLHDLGDNVWN